jgi:hypothetical protein
MTPRRHLRSRALALAVILLACAPAVAGATTPAGKLAISTIEQGASRDHVKVVPTGVARCSGTKTTASCSILLPAGAYCTYKAAFPAGKPVTGSFLCSALTLEWAWGRSFAYRTVSSHPQFSHEKRFGKVPATT